MNTPAEREFIISEIQKTANENSGTPLGQRRFEEETGIAISRWRGRYWRNWSDALSEAGFEPNKPKDRTDDEYLIQRLAALTLKLGSFPTYADLRLERQADDTFPTHQVFNRLGRHDVRVGLLRDYAKKNAEFSGLLDFLPEAEFEAEEGTASPQPDGLAEGFVYLALMQVGNQKRYKIGKAVLTARRVDQISIQLPEELRLVHQITTDDAFGIEAYWHKRFASKNTKGEWFSLSRDDVRAFKRRKFM
ncbi:MAG: GIY-YIG nuclease family protein [Bauldia sp.]|uniref:GIY-YIG nuclease family protein n=1 Tax=Bauldia sp. TaxID=2575872 RepID=UPI001D5D09D1|nr:GIY-YIG nuclease family protein [Bauldia sp.]MCB1497274.1 GIY-YIG nuclease family protein [Bauldia sp.]